MKDLSTEIKIDKAILSGSYAEGNYGVDSAIDLAIFSDSFKDMERIESIKYLLKRARKCRGVNQGDALIAMLLFLFKQGPKFFFRGES